jgi:hypothetical protein
MLRKALLSLAAPRHVAATVGGLRERTSVARAETRLWR